MPAPVLLLLIVGFFGLARPLQAQTPAQPADPSQAIPAQPVTPAAPVTVAPVPAAPGASAAAPSTNVAVTPADNPSVSIIADSSLKAVLQDLAQTWADGQPSSPQMPITLTNAGTMRGRMEAGGVWDLALDADVNDVQALTASGFLLADGQRSVARNTLVVYGRSPLVRDDDLDWFDLIGTEWKRVAMGSPTVTASGRVALRALHSHDLDDADHRSLFTRVANEGAALQLIQGDKADAAFVYRTDLMNLTLPGFEPFPLKGTDAPPIFYTGAVFRLASHAALARQFLDFCTGTDARAIWARHGFETD